jgi:hypothetical protein
MGNNQNKINNKNIKIIDNSEENIPSPKKQNIQYIWIDEDIYNKENLFFSKDLFGNEEDLICKKFDTVLDSFNYILNEKEIQFHKITIIVSGRLFINFYRTFKFYNDKIKISPIIIVFLNKKDFFILII